MRNRAYFMPLAIAIALLVLSCSPYRTGTVKIDSPMPAAYDASEGLQTAGKPSPVRWWEAFENQELNALMEEVFGNNLDLAQAYQRITQVRAQYKAARSALIPDLNIGASAGRAKQQGITGPVTSDSYGVSASASYELDVWKKLGSGTRAALLDIRATEDDAKALLITLSASLAEQYYTAVEQQAQIALTERTIASYRDNLELVELRYREGLVDSVDVYRARQNLHSATASLTTFERNRNLSLNAIAVLAGRFPEIMPGSTGGSLAAPPVFEPGVPSDLVNRRPDVRAARLRVEAADHRVAAAVADRYPSFNLAGVISGSSQELEEILDDGNILWSLLMEIALPVIDGGRRKAEVERAKAEMTEALAFYHETVLNAYREVKDALERNYHAEKNIRALEETVEAVSNVHRLALFQYKQGLSDYLPVQQAEQELFNTQSTLLSARLELISSRIELARTLGGGWVEEEFEKLASRHSEIKDR